MKSPFKFLDPYTAADKGAFWGREAETEALYDMVSKNRLLLVYGQSGTGKTSLVQCGLASRLDATDWYPITVRRGTDLNEALRDSLDAVPAIRRNKSEVESLQDIYAYYLRPAYLIFDQLEELFVFGQTAEQDRFANTIHQILESTVPCRIILVIREEYLAQLYGFEKVIPTLFDRRLRVEAMSAAKVKTVLEGSFQQFNIRPEAPAEAIYTQIIDRISGGKAGIQLPYLQVYLDMLYQEELSRSFPGEAPFDENGWKPILISGAGVARMGKIEDVLEKFLRAQQDMLQKKINEQFKVQEEDAVKKILDLFVSEEGTKRPLTYSWQGNKLILEKRWAELLPDVRPELLGACCRHLEQARLIRFEEKQLELAHDSLAALIDSQRSAQQRRLNDVRNRLRSQFNAFKDTQEYLSRRSLNAVEELMPQLLPGLNTEIKQFIEKSNEYNDRLEKAELQRVRRRATLGFSLAGVAMLGLGMALYFFRLSNLEHAKTLKAIVNTQLQTARSLKLEGKYSEAIALLDEARPLAQDDQLTEIEKLKNVWALAGQYVAQGDSLLLRQQVLASLDRYQEAQKISPDERMGRFIKEKSDAEYNSFILKARAMENARQWDFALKNYEDALHLRPDDPVAKARIAALKK